LPRILANSFIALKLDNVRIFRPNFPSEFSVRIFRPNILSECRLNEGFATYISYKGVKSAEPGWDMDAAFLTGDLHDVLDLVVKSGANPTTCARIPTPVLKQGRTFFKVE
jgi:hypothetical protein